VLLARAIVQRERGDADGALRALGELQSFGPNAYYLLFAAAQVQLALVRLAQERFPEADRALEAAFELRPGFELGAVVRTLVHGAWAALHTALGEHGRARASVERMPAGTWRELALARLLLAEGETEAVVAVLGPLAATSPRQSVELGLLRALSRRDDQPDTASELVAAALQTATSEGMLNTVIGAGPGIADLIEKCSWVVPDTWLADARLMMARGPAGPAVGRVARLIEQPTERERAAARFLASRLTIPEIARELGVRLTPSRVMPWHPDPSYVRPHDEREPDAAHAPTTGGSDVPIGPVEYVIIGFPGNEFNGEVVTERAELVGGPAHLGGHLGGAVRGGDPQLGWRAHRGLARSSRAHRGGGVRAEPGGLKAFAERGDAVGTEDARCTISWSGVP
jgi:MalT-like TPR region